MKKHLQLLVALGVFILLCASVAIITRNSQTLSEYASLSPELAYPSPAEENMPGSVADAMAAESMTGSAAGAKAAESMTGSAAGAKAGENMTGSAADAMEEENMTGSAADAMSEESMTGSAADAMAAESMTGSTADAKESMKAASERMASAQTVSAKEESSEMISSDRITYQPDFYYEPLSEEMKKRITGLSYKEDCPIPYEELRYVSVLYVNFKGNVSSGELICNQSIAQDLVEIFYDLYEADYQIEQIRLIDEYGADDLLSMQDNNSSCFNYRTIAGTNRISMHGQGLAVDINPFFNPYVTFRENAMQVSPVGAESYTDRSKPFAYKIDENDLCYKLFTEHGFSWGGNWNHSKDYQHFEKK